MMTEGGEVAEFMAVITWLIWKGRNEKCFEGKGRKVEQICNYGHVLLQEFKIGSVKQLEIQARQTNIHVRNEGKREPPEEHSMKINVDEAYPKEKAGVGLVMRKSKGEIEAVMVEQIPDCYDAVHVETLAILKALIFARDFGIYHCILEGDALSVIQQISNTKNDLSATRHIIKGIQSLLNHLPGIQIRYSSRKNNQAAHEAARIASLCNGNFVWFSNYPMPIMNAVQFDSLQ